MSQSTSISNPNISSLETAINCYFADKRFTKSNQGADSAWRGFSQQTIYICSRILKDKRTSISYRPEAIEDLAVIHDNKNDPPFLELVQVKSRGNDLTLSDLDPKENDSFLKHVQYFLSKGFHVLPKVVVFGSLGSELDGFTQGSTSCVFSIKKKLAEYGYDDDFIVWIAANLKFECCDEEALKIDLWNELANIVQVCPARSLFLKDIICRVQECSRFGSEITRESIRHSIREVGTKLAAISGYEAQYGRTLIPLFDYLNDGKEELEEEYRFGASARPAHIAAGLDMRRPGWMKEIAEGFSTSDVVIVKGASGQGKSSLCYRYLIDNLTAEDIYIISGLSCIEDARDLVTALLQISTEAEELQYAYVEGNSDPCWTWIAEQIASRGNNKLKLLISIREEDFNCSGFNSRRFPSCIINLRFSATEAEALYNMYPNPPFPSFGEAWSSFGGQGPLMEFAASLESGISLRDMLEGQIRNLMKTADDSWVAVLQIVANAGKEGLDISQGKIKSTCDCPNIYALLNNLENEHLVRVTKNGTIAPFHPFRCRVIAEILQSLIPTSEEELLLQTIKCAQGPIAALLVEFLERHNPSPQMIIELAAIARESWVKASEIIKALMWKDARRLFCSTQEIRSKISNLHFSQSFVFMLTGGVSEMPYEVDAQFLIDCIQDNRMRDTINEIMEDARSASVDYEYTDKFLVSFTCCIPEAPNEAKDLSAAGFVLGTISLRGLSNRVNEGVLEQLVTSVCCNNGNLSESLDFLLGLTMVKAKINETVIDSFTDAVFKTHKIVRAQMQDNKICCLQTYDIFDKTGESPNDAIVNTIIDLKRLYPNLDAYENKLIGFKALTPEIEIPDTEKHIPAKNLPLHWANLVDFFFLSMCDYDQASDSWKTLELEIQSIFEVSNIFLTNLSKDINRFYEKGCFTWLSKETIAAHKKVEAATDGYQILEPKNARNSYGFFHYASSIDSRQYGNADKDAYGDTKGNPFLPSVTRCILFINTFVKNCTSLIRILKDGSTETTRANARISLINIISFAEQIENAQQELNEVYGSTIIDSSFKNNVFAVVALWNYAYCTPLAKRKSVVYSQRIRVKKLMKARDTLIGRLVSNPCLESLDTKKPELHFRFLHDDLLETFPEIFDAELHAMYPDLKQDEYLFESKILPSLLGPVEIDVAIEDQYILSKRYNTQLLLSGDPNKAESLATTYQRFDPIMNDAISEVISINTMMAELKAIHLHCAEVNANVSAFDTGRINVNEGAYLSWKSRMHANAQELIANIENLIQHIYPDYYDRCSEEITMLKSSSNRAIDKTSCNALVKSIDYLWNLILGNELEEHSLFEA